MKFGRLGCNCRALVPGRTKKTGLAINSVVAWILTSTGQMDVLSKWTTVEDKMLKVR
jgi:hypothetical protein